MNILVIRLSGLQSWGTQADFEYRKCGDGFPTLSGLAGLFGNALGYGRSDPRNAELGQSFRIAVRADKKPKKVIDINTITKRKYIHTRKFIDATGKELKDGRTIMRRKEYLTDAVFTVFISADDGILFTMRDALNDPARPLFLGRSCCFPRERITPVITGEYTSLMDAIKRYPLFVPLDDRIDGCVTKYDDELVYQIDSDDKSAREKYDIRTSTAVGTVGSYKKRMVRTGRIRSDMIGREA